MSENNNIMSVEGQLVGMPLAGPESFSQAQLDYLKRALGVDETVLWSDDSGATSVTLSESYYNFERVKFTYLFVTNLLECTVPTQSNVSSLWLGNTIYRSGDSNPLQIIGLPVSITNSGLTATTNTGRTWWYPGNSGSTFSALKLVKVVGIGRIAGGN